MYSEFGEQLHSINLTAARTKVDLTTICPIEKLAATCQQLEEKLRNRDRDVDSESIPSSRGYFLMLKTDQDDDDGDHEHGKKILMEYRQGAFSISFLFDLDCGIVYARPRGKRMRIGVGSPEHATPWGFSRATRQLSLPLPLSWTNCQSHCALMSRVHNSNNTAIFVGQITAPRLNETLFAS